MMRLRKMVRAPLLCLGGIVIAIALNPGLASILCVTIPLPALTIFLILRSSLGSSV